MQKIFSAIDYGFTWTSDWYEFDVKVAERAALKARNDMAKSLRAQGRKVFPSSLGTQLVSRGGIGSGHPHIELLVKCYCLDWS